MRQRPCIGFARSAPSRLMAAQIKPSTKAGRMTGICAGRQAVLAQVSHARTAVDGKDGAEEAAWSSMAVHSSDVPEYASLHSRTEHEPCAGVSPVEATDDPNGMLPAQAHVRHPAQREAGRRPHRLSPAPWRQQRAASGEAAPDLLQHRAEGDHRAGASQSARQRHRALAHVRAGSGLSTVCAAPCWQHTACHCTHVFTGCEGLCSGSHK